MSIDTRSRYQDIQLGSHTYEHAEVILDGEDLRDRIVDLGNGLAEVFEERDGGVHVIGIYDSAKYVTAGLEMAMQQHRPNLSITSDNLNVKTFGAGRSSSVIRVVNDLADKQAVERRHVLVVQGAVRTGASIRWTANMLKGLGAASIAVASLIDRPAEHYSDAMDGIDHYPAFTLRIPDDKHLVGYGLSYRGYARNYPDVMAIMPALVTLDT